MTPGTQPSLFPPPPTSVRWCLAWIDLEIDTRLRRWTLGWLRPGHRHVLAFRETPQGLLVVQQTVARLQVEILPNETAATYAAWLRMEKGAVAILEACELVVEDRWRLRGMSCVSVARSLLGWPAYPWQWWWTPAGFLRRLRRRHGLR